MRGEGASKQDEVTTITKYVLLTQHFHPLASLMSHSREGKCLVTNFKATQIIYKSKGATPILKMGKANRQGQGPKGWGQKHSLLPEINHDVFSEDKV